MQSSPVTIREMTQRDIAVGLRLCRLSHWNQLESDWLSLLSRSPDGCRVAEKNGEVIGTVATVRYQDRFSWLAMMLVDPKARRAGIGTQLLLEGLNILSEHRCIRLDATPAGRLLYKEHGFEDEYSIYRMTLHGAGGTGDMMQHPRVQSGIVRKMREEDLPAVFERDREVFGADRSELLKELFTRSPESAWVIGGTGIQGYCLSRAGFLYRQLGPIVADDEARSVQLLSHGLLEVEEPIVIDAPDHSHTWLQWLRNRGFLQERTFVRMHRGENRYPGVPQSLFGVLGPEFG